MSGIGIDIGAGINSGGGGGIPFQSDLDTWYSTISSVDILIPVQGALVEDATTIYKWNISIKAECTRDNKVLAYLSDILYLSFDCGYSYTNKIAFTVVNDIVFSMIYANGNISWATKDKIYTSTDNLATYNEIIVTEENGATWNPTYNSDGHLFREIAKNNPVFINGVEHKCWGNYGNSVSLSDNPVHLIHSGDSGLTYKIVYHFNTIGKAAARHVHNVSRVGLYWIAQTGDTAGQCNWVKLQIVNGLFTSEVLATGDDTTYYKTVGIAATATHAYWGSDCTGDTAKRTLFKVPIADLLVPASYEAFYSNANEIVNAFLMNPDTGELVSTVTGSVRYKILISKDYGETMIQLVTGVTVSNANYCRISPKNDNGWYRMDVIFQYSVGTLWLKIK